MRCCLTLHKQDEKKSWKLGEDRTLRVKSRKDCNKDPKTPKIAKRKEKQVFAKSNNFNDRPINAVSHILVLYNLVSYGSEQDSLYIPR